MALEKVTQSASEVDDALNRLSQVAGILACADKMIDAELLPHHAGWLVSEAIRGAQELLKGCHNTFSVALEALDTKEA
ncbi:hypothetical protein [Arenimonas aestuarii]